MTKIIIFVLILLLPQLSKAGGETTVRQTLTYALTTETAVGSGDYTAYYLTANRHGILSTDANTFYLRAAMNYNFRRGRWSVDACLDAQVQTNAYSKYYIQQAYSDLTYSWISLGFGAKEFSPVLRDIRLSSGSTIWSGNSRPIPSVYLITPDFVTIPGTRGWLQFYAEGSFGKLFDDDYKRDRYAIYRVGKSGQAESFLTTDVWFRPCLLFRRRILQ